MSDKPRVLVVGSIALDTINCPGGRCEEVVGGSATYFSIAASLFAPVSIVAVVGEDFPPEALEMLQSRGIDTTGIATKPGRTFRWAGRYEDDLNAAITENTELGVFADFDPEIPDDARDAEYVFLANINPTLQLSVLEQMNGPRLAALDTMNYWITRTRNELLAVVNRVNALVMNDAEAKMLTGENNLINALHQLVELGPEYAVVKKGEHGAVLVGRDFYFVIPAFPLTFVADPTGAGDSFAGGFMGWLARTDDVSPANLCRAVAYGAAAASFTVEGVSVERLASITLEDVEERLAKLGEMSRF
ncbi:MAG: sugar kinase [Candidatus Coatesbacteria bacterium]|nr:MAG: sugar kinase [Candidatus Coatesbacteria bacterium]